MLSMLIAYDADGNVIATCDCVAVTDEDGQTLGFVDFEALEASGAALTDVWRVAQEGPFGVRPAAGSGTWPEWLGSRAHEFRVEFESGWSRRTPRSQRSDHRIRALVHRGSGHRRERSMVEAAIVGRIAKAAGAPADIRDLVGGPDRPLLLDNDGRTVGRRRVGSTTDLPIIRVRSGKGSRPEPE